MKEQVYTTRFAAKRAISRLANPEEWEVGLLQGTSLFGIKAIGPKPVVVSAATAPNPTRVAELKRAKAKAATKKSPKAAKSGNGALGKRAQILADAEAGKLPSVPDFSAATHERFRPKLEELVKLVKAADIKGLKAFPINPISTSPKAMDRYRNLAVIALKAKEAP